MTESSRQLIGVAIPTLRELRAAVLASTNPESAVSALREAGFAGGDAVHSAFAQWLGESEGLDAESGQRDAAELPLENFAERVGSFFRDAGWGELSFSDDEGDGVAILDITDCWEGADESTPATQGCHVTTGMLAAFFGRIAGYPIAVLETECCAGEGSRCRFLMGNADVMNYKWEEMRAAELA